MADPKIVTLDHAGFVVEIDEICRANPRYRVLVRPYLLGQFRIQLLDHQGGWTPEGDNVDIVRELCTYRHEKMREVVDVLHAAIDPEAACEALAKPWNCEYPGGRIRLDNQPEDRPEVPTSDHSPRRPGA